MDPAAYLRSLIGRPWSCEASCWHLAVEVERDLFGRDLPMVDIPAAPTWRWMMEAIEGHPERARWREVKPGPLGTVRAADGAIVLMARSNRPAHVGVWLKRHQGVIHADQGGGVMLETLSTLRARGWARLRFYEPA